MFPHICLVHEKIAFTVAKCSALLSLRLCFAGQVFTDESVVSFGIPGGFQCIDFFCRVTRTLLAPHIVGRVIEVKQEVIDVRVLATSDQVKVSLSQTLANPADPASFAMIDSFKRRPSEEFARCAKVVCKDCATSSTSSISSWHARRVACFKVKLTLGLYHLSLFNRR